MNFNFKLNFGKSSVSDAKHLFSKISGVWEKAHVYLFFGFFISLVVLGIYIWQQSVFGKGWSAEKKQEYVNTQNKRVVFKESDFQKLLSDIQSRKDENVKPYQQIKDIFEPYQ